MPLGNANLGSIDALVIKLLSDGKKQWRKIYGGLLDGFVEGIAVTSDGFAITGLTANKNGVMRNNYGKTDWFLIKEKVQ